MRQAAFLRSINVGGRRVKNAELVALVEGLGGRDVVAYQAAGNLVFDGDLDAEGLCRGLSDGLGYEVPVVLRTLPELAGVAVATLFTEAELAASTGKVQVFLLERAPTAEVASEVLGLETPDDRLRVHGPQLYWLPIGRMSDSALDVTRIARLVGLQTCRTLGTLQRMAKKFG